MNYLTKSVYRQTAYRLNRAFPEAKPGIYSLGRKTFEFDGRTWTRQVPVKRPKPETVVFLALCEEACFDGSNFIMLRCPGKNNWHKQIVPALKRLLKRLVGKEPKGWDVSGLELASWRSKSNKTLRFDFQDGEFVPFVLP